MKQMYNAFMFPVRKHLGAFCLAAVLLAALTPLSFALLWCALLPFLFVVSLARQSSPLQPADAFFLPPSPFLAVAGSRGPPVSS